MSIKCKICKKEPLGNCDWMQGRCPHLLSMIEGLVMTHRNVSLVKSALRITACYFLAYCSFQEAAVLLGLAEVLGIVEELV